MIMIKVLDVIMIMLGGDGDDNRYDHDLNKSDRKPDGMMTIKGRG